MVRKYIAERILNKEKILANYNLYASQVQFEKQYKLYGELWKSMFELRISLDKMMVKLVNDDEMLLQKMRSEKYDEYVNNYSLFTGYLFASAQIKVRNTWYYGFFSFAKVVNL